MILYVVIVVLVVKKMLLDCVIDIVDFLLI